MIIAENITRTFGHRTALSGVCFHIGIGETVLLAGPNGSGKTTLLRILAGFAPATSGVIRINRHDMFDESEAARASLGYVPENIPLHADMRVTEYLRFRGKLRQLSRKHLRRRTAEVVEQFGLTAFRGEMIGALSKGQRARVALADALLHEPPALLLDDPLASLDAEQRTAFLKLLGGVRSNTAVLLATHFPDEGSDLFSRVLLLRSGHLLRDELHAAPEPDQDLLGRKILRWLAEDRREKRDGTEPPGGGA